MSLSPDNPNYQQSQTLTEQQSATYDNTLMISSNVTDIDGVYTCSVSNVVGYSSGATGMGGNVYIHVYHILNK